MATHGSDHGRASAIRDILRYLMAHPDAKDTIDGILKWWFPGGQGERKREDVREAVDELVARGWILKRETTPSHNVYGMDKRQLHDIENFLNEAPGQPPAEDGHR